MRVQRERPSLGNSTDWGRDAHKQVEVPDAPGRRGRGGMSADERISLVAGSAAHAADGAVDRHRRDTVVRRRGWLVRRALLFADVAGLMTAFVVSQLVTGGRAAAGYPIQLESAVFLLTVPVWVVMAKIYGLYDRDEERTDHYDDRRRRRRLPSRHGRDVAVLHRRAPDGCGSAGSPAADLVLAARGRARSRSGAPPHGRRPAATRATCRTRSSSAPATSARSSPASCSSIPSTGST